MKRKAAEITLRPFERSDFKRLISWVPTPEAHGQWCGSFFGYPLDESRLQRYLDSASQPNTRAIFTALLPSGEPVGHVAALARPGFIGSWVEETEARINRKYRIRMESRERQTSQGVILSERNA